MSIEELERLRREEEELQAKLTAARQRRAKLEEEERIRLEEEKRRKEMEKPVIIRVTGMAGGNLVTESEYRQDIVNYWTTVPGRSFRGYADGRDGKLGKNLIPVSRWERVEERLRGFPHLTIEWGKGVREKLDWYLNAPPWEFTVHPSGRFFLAKAGPRGVDRWVLSRIPGSDWDEDSRSWKLPVSEGWRIPKALEGIEGVVYSDEARWIIFGQVESRAKLDLIAKQTETDFIKEINGHRLRGFQGVGIEFGYYANGRMILADATGLGKTWQSVGLAELFRKEAKGEKFQTVIACKAANIPNWKRELVRLAGVEPVVCTGGTPDGAAVMSLMAGAPYALISWDTLGTYREVEVQGEGGVSYKREKFLWVEILKGLKINMFIGDEAHKIKNPDTNRSRAAREMADIKHMMLLTASPVLNRTEELWPLLYMVDPLMFKSHGQYVSTYTYGGKTARNVEELHELIRPMFLRRKKSEVMKDLPAINRITRFHDLTPAAKKRYDDVLAGVYEELSMYDPNGIGGTKSVVNVLAQITRLKQVCAADKVEYTSDLAMELSDEANGGMRGRVLIFSQFKATALAIARALGHGAVCTVKQTDRGFESMGAEERDALFENARTDPSVKYIVTTEAAQEGHNLEFCDWVIFNDLFWTPAAHDQCEGRAYGRLSDPHPIDSFYVVADIQIERWIMELLAQKLAIIEETVDGVEGTRIDDESIVMALINKMRQDMWRRG